MCRCSSSSVLDTKELPLALTTSSKASCVYNVCVVYVNGEGGEEELGGAFSASKAVAAATAAVAAPLH